MITQTYNLVLNLYIFFLFYISLKFIFFFFICFIINSSIQNSLLHPLTVVHTFYACISTSVKIATVLQKPSRFSFILFQTENQEGFIISLFILLLQLFLLSLLRVSSHFITFRSFGYFSFTSAALASLSASSLYLFPV